jgi:uncharacterized membrane protein YphA (DoxX/SURF4 family)
MDRRIDSAWWVLRVALGAGPVIAGADKFFNLLADWPMYLSPLAAAVLPVAPATFMRIVGGVEILVGLAILTNATRIGAWVLMAWLIGLAINLASTGMFFDLAVRDVEIAVAAFALARLTEAREAQAVTAIGSTEFGTVFKGGLV